MSLKASRFGLTATLTALFVVFAAASAVFPQKVVDKTVATVSDGVRTELITLSDLKWQLALQPGVSLRPISSNDLKAALKTMVDQRIFALEAKRLPRKPATETEIAEKIKEIISYFPTAADLEQRLREVGFTSVSDDNFEQIIADRIAIDKYLAFRFRSFIVVTQADEAKYYRENFVPNFRRSYPGLLTPTFEEKRANIHETLVEQKVAADIETFLDNAKQRVAVTYLSEV